MDQLRAIGQRLEARQQTIERQQDAIFYFVAVMYFSLVAFFFALLVITGLAWIGIGILAAGLAAIHRPVKRTMEHLKNLRISIALYRGITR